jgi:hypothetical protein
MPSSHHAPFHADLEFLWGWSGARSISRGLPMPVLDRGGIRVDTESPDKA